MKKVIKFELVLENDEAIAILDAEAARGENTLDDALWNACANVFITGDNFIYRKELS